MSALALLKILYFGHGWHLANFDKPLVLQPFEAWKHGPVNRVVYDQIKHKKSMPLVEFLTKFDPLTGEFIEVRANFSDEMNEFLSRIFEMYADQHAFKLSDLTHERGSPWEKTWQKSQNSVVLGMRIPDRLIKDWFVHVESVRAKRHRH